jgi:O-methyltransferase
MRPSVHGLPRTPSSTLARVRWREVLNRGLSSTTGYRIVKARDPVPARSPAKPRRNPFRRYHDEQARSVMKAVKPWTMTSYDRLFALIVAVRHLVAHDVQGAVVECGVWRGGSMQAVARTLLDLDAADRDLHLFDTFEGMPPPTEEDRRLKGASAEELMQSGPRPDLVRAVADLDDVRAGMEQTGYPRQRIHYHPGRVEDTIPAQAPERIALLRLDTDWYESTKHELEHLYERVTPGGVVIIDDYDYWEGARKAVDEYIAGTGAPLLLVPIDTGRIAVKP